MTIVSAMAWENTQTCARFSVLVMRVYSCLLACVVVQRPCAEVVCVCVDD